MRHLESRWFCIVSNNDLTREFDYPRVEVDGDIEQVLQRVLEMTLQGYRLLSHPLSGSVKPAINPYKSVLLSTDPGEIDYQEVAIAQGCLEKVRDMRSRRTLFTWGDAVDQDLRLMDWELIKSGIGSLAHVS